MSGGSAASFFAFLDKINPGNNGRDEKKDPDTGVGIDRLQVQSMEKHRAEARAKGYQPGARPRSKHQRGRIVRGRHETPGAE